MYERKKINDKIKIVFHTIKILLKKVFNIVFLL